MQANVNPLALDPLDHKILAALQEDSSLSNLALAAKVHASAPTCLRRVKRLVEEGVILRQVAIVAPEALGATLTALIEVSLEVQAEEAQQRFEDRAVAEKSVLQCYRVSPGPDFLLIAQVADMPAYHALAQRLFGAESNVRNVRTFFSIRRGKFDTRIAR